MRLPTPNGCWVCPVWTYSAGSACRATPGGRPCGRPSAASCCDGSAVPSTRRRRVMCGKRRACGGAEMNDAKGKIRKAASAVAGGAVSQVVGDALTPDTPQAAAAPAAKPEAPHEWVPEVEQHTVTHGADGSVEAKTGTVWRPETHGTESAPADVPTIEEFEQIDIHEDAFGNFIIDATERVVVHNHGHDETYVDHQHLVVPGDGTPGDTDIDVVEREDVVVHENPDGT